MLDDYDPDFLEEEEDFIDVEEGGEGSNRTFIMVAGGIGGLLLIAMICMAVYALVILPRQRAAEAEDVVTQTALAQQSTMDAAATETAIVMAFTPTFTETPIPTDTPTMTVTVEISPTAEVTAEPGITETPPEAGGPTADPRTATVQALLTQAAAAQTQVAGQLTTATPTSTLVGQLPDTGFFDDAGAPMLIALAGILVLVIFMARRLRQANA